MAYFYSKELLDKFLSHVEDASNKEECWNWTSHLGGWGYGNFCLKHGVCVPAHKWLWQYLNGPVEKGKVLDHLCQNRACVNPDHLEEVTNATNIMRGYNQHRAKTHCIHGHPFSKENTKYYITKAGTLARRCITCSKRRYYFPEDK